MLYSLESVQAGLRVRDGRRVFYLGAEDKLTPAARDWLHGQGVEVLPASEAAPKSYTTSSGGTLTEKPEDMTHLAGNVLVPKEHPRIAFRGMIDTLEAQILLCQIIARREQHGQLAAYLQELLDFVRSLIRADVLGEAVAEVRLCGMDAAALRERSHFPAKFYRQPHFMPAESDGETMLRLNMVRTVVRHTELACLRAFRDTDGAVTRGDILLALNRLSSVCWILMIRLKAGEL